MGRTGAMAIRPEWRIERLRSAMLSGVLLPAVLLPGIAAAQISTGGVNSGLSPFGEAASSSSSQRAPPYTYGLDAGVGETDNVALAPNDKISQTIAIVDTDFTVNERSRLLDANAAGNFSYLDYLQHAYGNQLIGRFDGMADAALIPGRLVWVLRDDFGQSAQDPYTPVTPSNIENINYITTGPDLKLRFGGVDFINVSARYARAQYQASPFDSNRLVGSIGLGRDVSAGGSISLNATTERVLFDNTLLNSDFERSSGFGRYEVHGARTDFVGDLGATVVSQSGPSSAVLPAMAAPGMNMGLLPGPPLLVQSSGSGSSSGPFAKLELTRRISASAQVILRAGRDLTDASSSFSTQTTGATGIGATTPAASSSESYRATYASASWEYQRYRTTLAITGRWEQDVYPGLATLDARLSGAGFKVERRLTRALTAQLLGNWYKSAYPHAVLASQAIGSTDYANTVLEAALAWRHGRGLEIRLRCDHDSYSVSNGDTGYHETRAFLTVGYRPTPKDSGEL